MHCGQLAYRAAGNRKSLDRRTVGRPVMNVPLVALSSKSRHPSLQYTGALCAILVTACLFSWHLVETLTRFPPGRLDCAELPFTESDHPFHFYYSQLTSHVFAQRRAFWTYDPTFMAGYAKTLIFPTSSTLYELLAVLWRGNPAVAYRGLVASTIFCTPIILALAARRLSACWSTTLLSGSLGMIWVWGWPSSYVAWGMGSYILISALSVWGGLVLVDWLDHRRTWSMILATGIAAFAVVAHPSALVIIPLVTLPAYLINARSMSVLAHIVTWFIPGCVALTWAPWWVPTYILRGTFGTTESGFINENVWERLQELVRADFPIETGLIVGALISIVGLTGMRRSQFWSLILGAIGLFSLGYLASAWSRTWKLQPGRYTQPFYALLVPMVAVGLPRAISRLSWSGRLGVMFSAMTCLALLLCVGLLVCGTLQNLSTTSRQPLNTKLPNDIVELAEALKQHTDSTGRILFEDRARVNLGSVDPFPGCNPSPLLPLLAPGQYIGGPYLYTHLASNFTQVGDGHVFTHDIRTETVDWQTFGRYVDLYNLRWVVFWSRPLTNFAEENPDKFRLIGQFRFMRLYELNRDPNWAITGSAKIVARPDRLEVSDAVSDSVGELVLSYHWIPTLRSASVTLRPTYREDDPVPFIAIDNPPKQFVIENGLW